MIVSLSVSVEASVAHYVEKGTSAPLAYTWIISDLLFLRISRPRDRPSLPVHHQTFRLKAAVEPIPLANVTYLRTQKDQLQKNFRRQAQFCCDARV